MEIVTKRFLLRNFVESVGVHYQLAIAHRQAPDHLVGCCGLRGMDSNGEMKLGIELAPPDWGRYAYAIEVGSALLDFGFSKLKLDQIAGSTVSANTRIAKLARWIGAEVVGISPASNQGWSHIKWVLTKAQWRLRNTRRSLLKAGGKDNGAPGLRPHYHPNYYAACGSGPDGHNVEAVCH
jgi:RimJ/RimL family protein N-acetyltransferase